ncbi:MAG TPA: YbaY family lipoprotein [Actinophytocola sp.]|nr:YbaY family lipoprotein [Actinophytocola sp.]
MRISGTVLLPADAPPFASATLHVRLLDASLADAPSVVLAEQTIPGVNRTDRTEQSVRFTLSAELPAGWTGSLIVAAHLDLVGDLRVHAGDLLSTASHPVPATGAADVVVPLEVIRS